MALNSMHPLHIPQMGFNNFYHPQPMAAQSGSEGFQYEHANERMNSMTARENQKANASGLKQSSDRGF
jgi:hypothetical protein